MNKQTDPQASDAVREKIAEQAFDWLLTLEVEDNPDLRKEFAAWLKRSQLHVEEYLMVDTTWRALDNLDRQKTIRIEELLATAPDGKVASIPLEQTADDERLPHRQHKPVPQPKIRAKLAFAAAIVVVTLATIPLLMSYIDPGATTYTTDLGEQTSFTLDDGSVVYMNTRSRIRVDFSDRNRTVELLAGEALFQVVRDPARPFQVTAGTAVVEVLGTRFNIYRHQEHTTVTVVEGEVAVTTSDRSRQPAAPVAPIAPTDSAEAIATKPVTLTAGEQVSVNTAGAITRTEVSDVDTAITWRQRQLVFSLDPLRVVADEFNRYNRLKIVIDGEVAGERQLSGVFEADDPESLVQFLASDPSIRVKRLVDRIVVSDR